jgi:glycosyltransferase involved in cell wall biosynthesis
LGGCETGVKRLLFLCQTLPYPPDGGVNIRTYNVLRLLSREFAVTALCFYRAAERRNGEEVRQSIRGLQRFASVEAFPIPQEHNPLRLLFDHLRSLITGRAYTVSAYESTPFRNRISELLAADEFDLVHLDSLDLLGYIPLLAGIPIVCVHHNVESSLLRRRAATAAGLTGLYIAHQSRLTEIEERRWCPVVALNITVSEADRRTLEGIAPQARFAVVPNGVNTQIFRPENLPQEGIVFVGGYSWQPNRDAMEYFARAILPRLRANRIDASVTWVGRASNAIQHEYAERHGVHLTGYVDDIRPLVQRAACYVAPLRAGGGTRLKILDAWAMGKAVVSTSVGCEGLDARDGENILVRDAPEEFANAVEAVLADEDLRQRLGAGARYTAETQYDWEVIGRPMLSHYRELLPRADDPQTAKILQGGQPSTSIVLE